MPGDHSSPFFDSLNAKLKEADRILDMSEGGVGSGRKPYKKRVRNEPTNPMIKPPRSPKAHPAVPQTGRKDPLGIKECTPCEQTASIKRQIMESMMPQQQFPPNDTDEAGTSAGSKKAWDKRGRGQKQEPDIGGTMGKGSEPVGIGGEPKTSGMRPPVGAKPQTMDPSGRKQQQPDDLGGGEFFDYENDIIDDVEDFSNWATQNIVDAGGEIDGQFLADAPKVAWDAGVNPAVLYQHTDGLEAEANQFRASGDTQTADFMDTLIRSLRHTADMVQMKADFGDIDQ